MKLDPEGVEKAGQAILNTMASGEFGDEQAANAALTAYFDHLRESGKMREATGFDGNPGDPYWMATDYWAAHMKPGKHKLFRAHIIRTEKE